MHKAPIIVIRFTMLTGVVTVTDTPSITDGVVYGVHV